MKYIIMAMLILPIVYWACRENKWYLYLTFALYGILPDACAIELSSSLPLVTVTRLLILLLLAAVIVRRDLLIALHIPLVVAGYFGVNVIVSLVNLRYGKGELNYIFVLLFEELLLFILIYNLVDTREEFERCLDFMIMGAVVLSITAVFQSVLHYDIAEVLSFVETRSEVVIQDRMGMTRAFATFNALSYATYCAFMSLIIWYRYEVTKRQTYIVVFMLNFIALLLTMSRSSLLALGIVLVLLLCSRGRAFIRPFLPYIPVAVLGVAAIVVAKPSVISALVETLKSALNTLGANYELDSNFGANATNGTYSRMRQWTSFTYMLRDGNWFFGYGYNGFSLGRAHYYSEYLHAWHVATELDVGFVAFLIQGGILGLGSYVLFIGYVFVHSFINRSRSEFSFFNATVFAMILLALLEFATSFSVRHLEWLFFALFFTYMLKIAPAERTAGQPAECSPGKMFRNENIA